ncbi:polygalacturonase precursor [Panicum miliaceum]|uniref:Polygalacturonase n=1 Tax=Panicum miliaceum TaxID=4540 RepID=A0A3L6TBX6_PANMI|nr:polygalacturonase precursor [Panicum miliaceum]
MSLEVTVRKPSPEGFIRWAVKSSIINPIETTGLNASTLLISYNTGAIEAAWNARPRAGGGATVFRGPCQGSVALQVDGTIVAPGYPDTWPANRRRDCLVFYQAHGVSLRGDGLVDGKWQKWSRTARSSTSGSTAATAWWSAAWPNTDGIHVEDTTDVVIASSAIPGGDDCVSIGAGTSGARVEDVTCGSGGHGISIGSLGEARGVGVRGQRDVRRAAILRSDNGVRIKTRQGGAGSVSAVSFEDVRVEGVRSPIVIDQYYCRRWVSYAGVRGTGITLSDVELLPASGAGAAGSGGAFCWNAYGSATTPMTLPGDQNLNMNNWISHMLEMDSVLRPTEDRPKYSVLKFSVASTWNK